MMHAPHPRSFAGVVVKGQPRLADRTSMLRACEVLGDGTPILVTIEVEHETRGHRANRYYWGVVLKIAAEHTGQSAEDIHDVMCAQFLPNEHKRIEFFNRLTGASLVVEADVRRSSKLNVSAFYDFVEQVRQWMAEFLCVATPDPDPAYWRKRKDAQNSEAA